MTKNQLTFANLPNDKCFRDKCDYYTQSSEHLSEFVLSQFGVPPKVFGGENLSSFFCGKREGTSPLLKVRKHLDILDILTQ